MTYATSTHSAIPPLVFADTNRLAFVFTPQALAIRDEPAPLVSSLLRGLMMNGHDVVMACDTDAGHRAAARLQQQGLASRIVTINNDTTIANGLFGLTLYLETGGIEPRNTLYVDHIDYTAHAMRKQGFQAISTEITCAQALSADNHSSRTITSKRAFRRIRRAVQQMLQTDREGEASPAAQAFNYWQHVA